MKKLLFAVALLCAPLTMTACATTPTTQIQATKADAAAWTALGGIADQLKLLADGGQLKGPAAAKAKVAMDTAHAALFAADQAYAAGRGQDAAQNVATASTLIANLLLIIAQAKGN